MLRCLVHKLSYFWRSSTFHFSFSFSLTLTCRIQYLSRSKELHPWQVSGVKQVQTSSNLSPFHRSNRHTEYSIRVWFLRRRYCKRFSRIHRDVLKTWENCIGSHWLCLGYESICDFSAFLKWPNGSSTSIIFWCPLSVGFAGGSA